MLRIADCYSPPVSLVGNGGHGQMPGAVLP